MVAVIVENILDLTVHGENRLSNHQLSFFADDKILKFISSDCITVLLVCVYD